MSEPYRYNQPFSPTIRLERALLRFAVDLETGKEREQTVACIVCNGLINSGYVVFLDNGERDQQEVGMCCGYHVLHDQDAEIAKATLHTAQKMACLRLEGLLEAEEVTVTVT